MKQASAFPPIAGEGQNLYVGIDAIRCLAAFAVMSYHFLFLVASPGPTPQRITQGLITEPLLPGVTGWGYLGVQAFFVISGFVIYASLNANSAGQFLAKRFLRLAPALWICATITLVVAILAHDGSIGKIITRYLISITFFPFGKQIDGSYWTLRVEVGFYISVFAMMLLARPKLELYFRTLCITNFAVSAVSFLSLTQREWLGKLGDIFVLHHGSYFAIGIYLNKLVVQKDRTPTNIGLMILAILGSYAHMASGMEGPAFSAQWLIWTGILAIIIFAVAADPVLSRLTGQKGAKKLRAVGKATYPFYLVHQLVGCFVIYLAMSAGASHLAAATLALATIIALTVIVTHLEKPLGTTLKPKAMQFSRRLDQHTSMQAAAAE